ncbi:hypothetical protein F5Y02DRAFT_424511 [Annulohypoxylon stygium]|nr:hypothetical protein F5Y02DRAFT_424511 [Annulohypoxylon stygium]
MPHAAKSKKQTRPRANSAISAVVSYPIRSQQQGQDSSSAPSSSSYTWTAADAARDSQNGAFLTAWPPEQAFYIPPIHLLGQPYQSQARAQNQSSQYNHSSTHRPSTVSNQGGSASSK